MARSTPYRFVTEDRTDVERLPRGLHHWISRPGLTEAEDLLMVRVEVEPGNGHPFHHHPEMEEIIYVLDGRVEQWVERERRELGPGEAVHVPPGIVHATFNSGDEPVRFLAVLSPAEADPFMVEVDDEEPWRSLRD